MSDKHYFTAVEINAMIPQLEHIFEHIETCRARAEELAAQALRGFGSSEPSDVAGSQLMRSQVEFLMQAIQEDIQQVQDLGGTTKDIEMGLVDFLGDVEGHDVWLCWKRGETSVRFWHPMDAGFSQRRALPQTRTRSH